MVDYFPLKFGIVFIFLGIGLFGNINLMLIYLRTKQMRSKTGSLLFLGAIIHLMCLLFSPANATIILHMNYIGPTTCTVMSAVYITGLSMAGTVTIMMAFDLLLNMVFPFRYRLMTATTFCLIIFPCLCIPIAFCVFSFYKGEDVLLWFENRHESNITQPTLQTCDEQYELREDMRFWFIAKNVLLTATTIIYIICILLLKFGIGLNPQTKRQIMKCTLVIVCCFVIACMFHVTCTILLLTAHMHEYAKEQLMNFSRLHMYLCLSYNFYICIWRSSKLREAFKDNMYWMVYWKLRPKTPPNSSNISDQCKSPRKITSVAFQPGAKAW